MGDNVWYEYYENSTILIVTGTGSTWDFDDYELSANEYGGTTLGWGAQTCSRKQRLSQNANAMSAVIPFATDPEGPLKIVVQEGITRLGREALAAMAHAKYVLLPSTLEEIGEYAFMGSGMENAEWIGLDFERINVAKNAFLFCYNENIEEILQYRERPTPTPTPSPTPIPNPDKPRLVETRQMGDNVTYEFWDNGYLYVKGSGATWNQSFYFDDFEGEFYQTIHTVVIDEGITYLGDYCFNNIKAISHWRFPKSLTSVGNPCGGGDKVTFDGYYEGRAVTMKTHNARHSRANLSVFFDELEDVEAAKAKGYEITFH